MNFGEKLGEKLRENLMEERIRALEEENRLLKSRVDNLHEILMGLTCDLKLMALEPVVSPIVTPEPIKNQTPVQNQTSVPTPSADTTRDKIHKWIASNPPQGRETTDEYFGRSVKDLGQVIERDLYSIIVKNSGYTAYWANGNTFWMRKK